MKIEKPSASAAVFLPSWPS